MTKQDIAGFHAYWAAPKLHEAARQGWDEADLQKNMESGFYQGTEIAVDQLVAHVNSLKQTAAPASSVSS